MAKNYDPATPDAPGPETRPCTDCRIPIMDAQARRTFEIYDVPLCQRCAENRDNEIASGRITKGPEKPRQASGPARYELYQVDPHYGNIYQAPENVPLPPGAIGQGFHRPKRGGICYQLFRMPDAGPTQDTSRPPPRATSPPGTQDQLDPETIATLQAGGFIFQASDAALLQEAVTAFIETLRLEAEAISAAAAQVIEMARAQTQALTDTPRAAKPAPKARKKSSRASDPSPEIGPFTVPPDNEIKK